MKALGLLVSDKKIFENCILKTYFLTPWPTYATNQNHLNNLSRGPHRDHSCEVWSKSNERLQRKRCLSKNVYARRTTHEKRRTTTDDGQSTVTIAHPVHFVLRWAKNKSNYLNKICFLIEQIKYICSIRSKSYSKTTSVNKNITNKSQYCNTIYWKKKLNYSTTST